MASFGSGFANGPTYSSIVILMFDTSMYAFFDLNAMTLTIVDVIVGTLFGVIVRGVVGLVLGTGKQE